MDRISFGPAKNGSLAYAGNRGRFVDSYEIALFVALNTPTFNDVPGPPDYEQTLGFDGDASSPFLHLCDRSKLTGAQPSRLQRRA
jgi:hypothetical protein